MSTSEAYFHVVRQSGFLDAFANELFSAHQSEAADFIRINQNATQNGYVRAGQLLYVPAPLCYHPDYEAEISDEVARINWIILNQMTQEERQLLAEQPTLINSAAENPSLMGQANIAAGVATGAVETETRLMRSLLRDLEQRYIASYQTHGKLTPQFYAERRSIYRNLDSAIGGLVRLLTTDGLESMAAKRSLKISTKSQILYWKRHGTAGGVRDLRPHFDRLRTASKWMRGAGAFTITVDAYLTGDTIMKACQSGDQDLCHYTAVTEGSAFAGGVAGGLAGGALAYAGCNALIGIPTLGTSVLWCGLVAGGVGSIAAGSAGSQFGRHGGAAFYEWTSN